MDSIILSPAPMPYLTDCSLKRFGTDEYHCSRYCSHFVLIFMLKNRLQFTENGSLTSLRAGEWYIQKKNTWQAASRPSPNAEYYYIHFQADYTEDLTSRLMLPTRGAFQPGLFLPLLQRLCLLLHQTPCSHLELQSEFFRLLGLLYTQEQSYSALTADLMRYLNDNYASRITARTLSDVFHYSADTIHTTMKAERTLTDHAYPPAISHKQAKNLLDPSQLPVQKIALECGFSDNSLFYKAFRKHFSQSPSEWRRQHQFVYQAADPSSQS